LRNTTDSSAQGVGPGQQLLGDGVAVVVGEHVAAADPGLGQHGGAQVRLLADAVVVAGGLGRAAEAEQVRGDQAVALAQRRPQRVPVPAAGREAVDQQQGVGAVAVVAHKDPMAAHVQVAGRGVPAFELDHSAPPATAAA
jgi:hypothetical protein